MSPVSSGERDRATLLLRYLFWAARGPLRLRRDSWLRDHRSRSSRAVHHLALSGAVYGTTLVTVDGNYDAVNRLCGQIADHYGWGFANINLRPFYSEGSKTMSFEIAEQLNWATPDSIIVPMAGASLLTKMHKG